MEGKLNSFVSDLSLETNIDFPTVSLKWALSNDKEELIFDDFDAIIVMHDRKYRNRNFVHAAYFFVSEALIRKTKYHLFKNLKKSLDLYIAKEILEKENFSAVEQFLNDHFNPELEKSESIKYFVKNFIK